MAENPSQYAQLANEGILLGYPVKIGGVAVRPDNGINYHSTIKYFDKDKDHPHAIHELAQHLPLNPPDAKNTQIKFDKFKDRLGNDVHVITLHGNSAEKLKEQNAKFSHMGFPSTFEWTPHISVDKDMWDKVQNSGAKTAHEAGIEFGPAHLKKGPQVLKTYHHEPDSAEPKVPDLSDMTAKATAKSESMNELRKAPFINEDYGMVSLPDHPSEEGKYRSTLINKQTGQRIHRYDLPEDKGAIYAVTENGHHAGKIASQIHVYHHDLDSGEEVPHVAYALTEKGHEGKGLSTSLHQAALKDYGQLGSDRRLSPGSQKIWEKLAANPKNKVKFGPTKGVAGGEERHMATYKAENVLGQKPLTKPYVSEAQRRWAHTPSGKKALGGEAGVHHWDEATKGKKLPERVAKSEWSEKPWAHGLNTHHYEKMGHKVSITPNNMGGHRIKINTPKGEEHIADVSGPIHHAKGAAMGMLEHHIGIQKSEDILEKSALKNAGIALGMAGALAGASPTSEAANRSPASIPHQKQPASVYDHQRMLRALSQIESSSGKNVHHRPLSDGSHAYGQYALTPDTIKSTIKMNKDLKTKHGRALALQGDAIHKYMQDHKGLEDVIADRNLSHLEQHFGNNLEQIAFGWLNGTQGTINAKNKGYNFANHWYSQRVKKAYENKDR